MREGSDRVDSHGDHVTFVVHEASVEVRSIVARWRGDMRETTRKWIFEEVQEGCQLLYRRWNGFFDLQTW